MTVLPAAQAGASAPPLPVPLGEAADFAVLAGSTVTNTGATTVTGDLGLSPGTAVTGFPPGTVSGTIHTADAAAQAKVDLATAYDDAAARTPATTVPTELGTTTLTPGVYTSTAGTFGITGTLTLDAQGNPDAVFIFQTASTLITASASTVTLTGGAQASNVFWQVGSSATLGTGSSLAGNILALTSITATTGVSVNGRVLARNGAVTLDTNTITKPTSQGQPCATATTTTTLTSSDASVESGPITFTATVTSSDGTVPTGPVLFRTDGSTLGTASLDAGGHATLTVTDLPPGVHRIFATFPGTARLDPSTSPLLIQRVGINFLCPAPTAERKSAKALRGSGTDPISCTV
ncbi:ice-binding family protein [Streptosporangium canum]|uniref:ice-binding family protein n=1 Tax=Streptosporangium canum TaxID=324952 RepID=UPI003445B8B2